MIISPKIVAFITRDNADLRSPRSRSLRIEPRWVNAHYLGPETTYRLDPDPSKCECRAVWKSVQDFHMDDREYVDVAYTGAVCQAGHALAGRGAGVRTAANGTEVANTHGYAIVFLIGGSQSPSTLALQAFVWWVVELGMQDVRGHRDEKSTACPGDKIYSYVQSGALEPRDYYEEDVLDNIDYDKLALAVLNKQIAMSDDPDKPAPGINRGETSARWIAGIMERARELISNQTRPPLVTATIKGSDEVSDTAVFVVNPLTRVCRHIHDPSDWDFLKEAFMIGHWPDQDPERFSGYEFTFGSGEDYDIGYPDTADEVSELVSKIVRTTDVQALSMIAQEAAELTVAQVGRGLVAAGEEGNNE